jgi:hypothetical protein
MTDDPLKFAVPDDQIRERQAVVPRKIQKRREHFVKVPWVWIERLEKVRQIATYRVALQVLYQHWKGRGEPFTLSNGMLRMSGVSRWQKWRGLRELRELGLITVVCRSRKSPRITVLV